MTVTMQSVSVAEQSEFWTVAVTVVSASEMGLKRTLLKVIFASGYVALIVSLSCRMCCML